MAFQLFRGSGNSTTDPQASIVPNTKTTLQFWGVFDDPSVFQPIIAAYQAAHPNVTVVYSRKELNLYEFVSLNLLASQEGPDVWLIPSEWLPKHGDKLNTVPEGFLSAQNIAPVKTGLFQKKPAVATNAALFSQFFAPVTADNNLVNNKIKVIPLSVDTLGLYGNTALLQQAGVSALPATWGEVVTIAKQLAKRTTTTISQPVIGLGAADNVSRASEILATLMMQNHTPMISDDKAPAVAEALFNQTITKSTGEPIQPGPSAIDFYTSFASPTKENFSWSRALSLDYDQFIAGKLPLYIDYSYRVRDIQQQAPTLSFNTTTLPQVSNIDTPLTLSTSQVVGVPIVSRNAATAWNFIQFLTNEQNSAAYAHAAGRPPARLKLASDQTVDPKLGPFITQIGFAQTWYRNEINKTDGVFKQAIEAVLAGQTVTDVTNKLTKQVTHILRNEPHD